MTRIRRVGTWREWLSGEKNKGRGRKRDKEDKNKRSEDKACGRREGPCKLLRRWGTGTRTDIAEDKIEMK